MNFYREACFFLEQITCARVEIEARNDVHRHLGADLFQKVDSHKEINYILDTIVDLNALGCPWEIVQYQGASSGNPGDYEQWGLISDEVVYTYHGLFSLDLFEEMFKYPLQGSSERFWNVAKTLEGNTAKFPLRYESETDVWAYFYDPIDEGKSHASVFVPSEWQKRLLNDLISEKDSILDDPLSPNTTHFQILKPLASFRGMQSLDEAVYSLPPFFSSDGSSANVSLLDVDFYEKSQAIKPLLRVNPNEKTVQVLLWPKRTNKGFANFHIEINTEEDLKLFKSLLLHVYQQDRYSKNYSAINYANTDGTQEQSILSLNFIRHCGLFEQLKNGPPQNVQHYVLGVDAPQQVLSKNVHAYPYVYRTQHPEADQLILNTVLKRHLNQAIPNVKPTQPTPQKQGRF